MAKTYEFNAVKIEPVTRIIGNLALLMCVNKDFTIDKATKILEIRDGYKPSGAADECVIRIDLEQTFVNNIASIKQISAETGVSLESMHMIATRMEVAALESFADLDRSFAGIQI